MSIVTKLIGLLFFIVLSPLFLIVALIIMIDDGFPIFFVQKRIGINNTEFWLYKFRTMRKGIPDIPTHLVDENQKLYTRIGPLFRKFSIDELPQLINIIKGEMVFIGPRPALYNQDDLADLRIEAGVHTLMPGVTGWAQVNGRDELSVPDKVKMDGYYLEHRSIKLYIKILWLTLLKVLKAEGVSH